MQLARPAFQSRRGNMVGTIREDRLHQQRDVFGIVGPIGIEEDRDRPAECRNRATNRLPLSKPAVRHHPGACSRRNVRGAVSRVPHHDDDIACVWRCSLDDAADTGRLLLRRDHDRDVVSHVTRNGSSQMSLDDRVGVTGDVHRVDGDAGAAVPSETASADRLPQRPARTFPRMD
jgi:hypothetical protein